MKITTYGLVLCLKNLGIWLASYGIAGIKTDPQSFIFAFVVYACISVPSDLLLMNHASSNAEEVKKTESA